jgi:hypothetical protein
MVYPMSDKSVLGTPGRTLEPLNLVTDIDQIVQQRIQERPDLRERTVRLSSGREGELRIYVDAQVFEAVDDITDFRVRELIRDAIREWEGI